MNHPMKVLTPAEMGAVDRATIAAGIPGIILMENAAHRVVEFIAERFAPVSVQRIVVICGKGNNGGDGLAIARILQVRFQPKMLRVVLICDADELTGEAATNLAMLHAAGIHERRGFDGDMRTATLVVDAVLGTGLEGAARGEAMDAILAINTAFPLAKVVAVDIPSGLAGGSGTPPGDFVRADATVTFTAPKICHAMPPACNLMGELRVAPIGSAASLYDDDEKIRLALITPQSIAPLFAPRAKDSNKGRFGHVLVVAGSRGKSGAAAMVGMAALRAGAGLVTVACPESVLPQIALQCPELMTEPVAETSSGSIALAALPRILELAGTRTLVALGPGIGADKDTREVAWQLFGELDKPLVMDADGLNAVAGTRWNMPQHLRILTPHPGEMARLTGRSIDEIQADRITAARTLAESGVTVVLKGERTLVAFPDRRVWINPTGSPALAKGGTGDVLCGMVAALVAQFSSGNDPDDTDRAIAGAVYLHGLAGELAAEKLGEQAVLATDLFESFGEAIRGITHAPDHL